jgi:hypothetical protein
MLGAVRPVHRDDLYEWARTLQILVYDRVRRPIGECADGIRGIVPGVLLEGGGTHYEEVGYIPALQIAIQPEDVTKLRGRLQQ